MELVEYQSNTIMNVINLNVVMNSLSTVVIFLFGFQVGYSEVSLGNKGALAFGGDAELEYNSNISANSSEDGDVIATVLPKVFYRYDQGAFLVNAFVGIQFVEYDEQSQFDSESLKSGLVIEYPSEAGDGPFELVFNAGYNESTRADGDLQAIVEREVTRLGLAGTYYLADRYYIKSGIEYKNDEILTAGFTDIVSYSLPINIFYHYSEDLAFGIGYRYRKTEVDGAAPTADSRDDAVYLAAEGQLSPSVKVEVKFGMQQRDFDTSVFEDNESIFAEIEATWSVNERSRLQLTAGNEFDTAASNTSAETLYAELELRHVFNEKLTATTTAVYKERDYSNLLGVEFRNDDAWSLEVEVSYELIEDRLSLFARGLYGDQSSNVVAADYGSSSISFGLSAIF